MTKVASSRIAAAFKADKKLTLPNTKTCGTGVMLFDNLIAWKSSHGLYISMSGWPTRTTRDRLQAILEVYGSPLRFQFKRNECIVFNNDNGNSAPFNPAKSYNVYELECDLRDVDIDVFSMSIRRQELEVRKVRLRDLIQED